MKIREREREGQDFPFSFLVVMRFIKVSIINTKI